MYALIEFACKQIKVEEGSSIKVPYVDGKVGSKVAFDKDGNSITLVQSNIDTARTELNTAAAAVKYKSDRAKAFASTGDQLDMQYWDAVNGTTTWKDHVAKVKSDNPKPS